MVLFLSLAIKQMHVSVIIQKDNREVEGITMKIVKYKTMYINH